MKLDVRLCGAPSIPTVCPSHDSVRILFYQERPTSIQWWGGHDQEAKRGETDGPRITRHEKRLGRFSSRVRHWVGPLARGCLSGATPRGSAVDVGSDAPAWAQRAERAADGGVVDVSRPLSSSPHAPRMHAQRVARSDPSHARNCLPPKK
jgi:hypothetical protein